VASSKIILKENRHAFRRGRYTGEAIAERRAIAALLCDMKDLES
jgi:hypothetical protein